MIYCQRCLTPNDEDAVVCKKCGEKLFIIAKNQYWEEATTPQISIEDHFLERISRLEETVSGVLEHLSRMTDSLEQLDRNSFITRSGLAALVETLKETKLLREDLLNQRWEATITEQLEEAGARERFGQLRNRFIALYRGKKEQRTQFVSLIEEAEFFIYSDRSVEGIEVLTRAIDLDYQNYELAYFLAEYFQQRGQVDEAVLYLKMSLDANKDHADALLMLALLYYGEEKVTEAQELLSHCIEVNPHNTVALLSMASILCAEGRLEGATPYLMRVNELEPQAQAYFLLGQIAKDKGELKKAIPYLQKAIELEPDHEDAIFNLGLAYLERGWTRKARKCFADVQALNPLRLTYEESYQLEEATQQGERDMDEDGQKTLAFAQELFHQGKYKQALPHFRQLIKRYPNNAALVSSCAVLFFALRRYDETVRMARKALDLELSDEVRCAAFTLQMESLRALSRFDEAIAVLERMAQEFPEGHGRTVACYGLAMTKADMGHDLKEAETLAKEAVDGSEPDFRHNAMDALGWVYFKQGRYEEALSLLEASVQMSESISHLYHYGMILLALNLQTEAFKVFEKTVKLRSKTVKVDDFIFAAIHRELNDGDLDA